MRVSRTMSYALHAVLQLARAGTGKPIPCSRLAREGKMPERFLLQILRSLVNQGLLRSTRGVEGGYSLTRTPEEISLLDIFEAIDNPFGVSKSEAGSLPDGIQKKLDDVLAGISETACEVLQSYSLKDFNESQAQAESQIQTEAQSQTTEAAASESLPIQSDLIPLVGENIEIPAASVLEEKFTL